MKISLLACHLSLLSVYVASNMFLVGMGPGSETRGVQKGQDCRRLGEMGYTLRNGRSLTGRSPGGRKKAIRSRSGYAAAAAAKLLQSCPTLCDP